MKVYFLSYLASLITFVIIDGIWLAFIAKDFYQKHIGHLLSSQVNFGPAIIFYLLFLVGILVFCISPAIEKDSLLTAILLGAFFGLVTYATYDLTNWATLKDWPFIVVFVDMLWGAFLASIVSTAGFLAWKYFA
ncbi:MAG: DUF2177 family protein [Candidatus Moranbacteria bacterium]|nr:DUF2177 family protein [Candidatus Moranbacteria bacterium]